MCIHPCHLHASQGASPSSQIVSLLIPSPDEGGHILISVSMVLPDLCYKIHFYAWSLLLNIKFLRFICVVICINNLFLLILGYVLIV